MAIEVDDNMQYEINLAVLQAWDDEINAQLGTGDRVWITDSLLPDVLPLVERITTLAIRRGTDGTTC